MAWNKNLLLRIKIEYLDCMSIVDDLLGRYRNLDDVDRERLWTAVIAIIVLVVFLYMLGGTLEMLSLWIGRGGEYANQTIQGLGNITSP
jgi:hypothetical protein